MYAPKTSKIFFLKREMNKIGGLEKATRFLLSGFAKKGYDVHLICADKLSTQESIHIHCLEKKKGFSFLKIAHFDKACLEFLSKQSSNAIFGLDRNSFQTHIRAGNGCHLAYLNSRKEKNSFLLKINPLHRLVLSIEKKSFEHPDLRCLFTNSQMVKNEILSSYNVDENKIHVVHNGVEWNKLKNPFEDSCKKRPFDTLGLNPYRPQLLFVGHNYQRKGLVPLLQALSRLKEIPFQLSIVGKDKNLSYFQKLASRLQLQDKVIFWGSQLNTLPFYQCADILTVPSFYDPFANVTLEGLAMGLFVLSSKTNGGSEILTDKSGTVINDLSNIDEMVSNLEIAFTHIKTKETALTIRNSIKHLDFSNQIDKIITKTHESLI